MVALFLCCGEPRQCVSSCVILLTDMFHHYFLEPGDEVADRMVILLQQGFLDIKLFLDLADHHPPLQVTSRAPMSYVRFNPARIASYSAWFLVALNSNWRACSKRRSSSPSRKTPAPYAALLEESSMYIVHLAERSCWGVSSVEKSAKHWDLIAPLDS